MKTIITTVGTSIFTNYLEKKQDIKDKIEDLKMLPYSNWKDNIHDINSVRKSVGEWAKDNEDSSAEIKSLLKINETIDEDIEVRLLATDTILSVLAAEIIRNLKISQNRIKIIFNQKNDIIKSLQVTDKIKFEKDGVVNFVDSIHKIIQSSYFENVILNITGGYKALIPYMTIIGQINNISIYYIFENTNELIKIPQAPISINWEMFEKYSKILNDLDSGIDNWEAYKRKNNISDDFSECIWEEDNLAELNAIGKIFWKKYQDFFIAKIEKGSNFFNDKTGNRNQIVKSLKELYTRLMNVINSNKDAIKSNEDLLQYINNLSEKDDLRHGGNPDRNKFIFKSTNIAQIRIVYTPVYTPDIINQNLKLFIYDYVRGQFKHSQYIMDFQKKLRNPEDIDFISIPIKKKEN